MNDIIDIFNITVLLGGLFDEEYVFFFVTWMTEVQLYWTPFIPSELKL